MNVLNRVLIILISLVALVASIAVLLVTIGMVDPETLAPNNWFQNRLAEFEDLTGTDWNWAIAVSGAVILVSLLLLTLELRPGQREPSRLVVKQDGMGRVTVALDSVRRLVDWEAQRESGVMESESQVREEANGLQIRSRVSLSPQASAPEVAELLQERIKNTIEHHIGKRVSQVTVDTQLEPLGGRDGRRRVR
jgi:hypothetical protein